MNYIQKPLIAAFFIVLKLLLNLVIRHIHAPAIL